MEDRTKQELRIVGSKVPGFDVSMMVLQYLSAMLRWVSAPLECFLRKDFGERYMSWLRLWAAHPFVLAFAFVPTAFGTPSILYWMIYVGFIGMGLWHRFVIWKRNREGSVMLHSQCPGMPWGKLNVLLKRNPEAFETFIEPLACVLIALCVGGLDKVVGVWMLLASVALLIHRQLDSMARRNRYLDMIDAKIEGHFEGLMLKEHGDVVDSIDVSDREKTQGYIAPPKYIRQQLSQLPRQPVEVTVAEAMGSELPLKPV